jgi:gelsolin
LSYFPRLTVLRGGVSSGFHEVADIPPPELLRLYRITFTRGKAGARLRVREVPPEAESLVRGDAYVLDKGTKVMQFNSSGSAPQEKFKAAEFVQELLEPRKGQCELTVYGQLLRYILVSVC